MGWFNHQLETDSQSPTLFLELSINSSLVLLIFWRQKKTVIWEKNRFFREDLETNIYINKSRVHGFQLCLLRSTGQDLLFGVTVYGRDFSRHVRIWLEDLRTPGDGSWNIQKNTGAVSVSFVKDSPPSVAPALWQNRFLFFSCKWRCFFLIWMTLIFCVKNPRSVHLFFVASHFFSHMHHKKLRTAHHQVWRPLFCEERGEEEKTIIDELKQCKFPAILAAATRYLKTDRIRKWIDQCR